MKSLVLKTLFFTLIAPCVVTVVVPYWLLPSSARLIPQKWEWNHFTGLVLLIAGLAIYLWCAWDLIARGQGTPAPYDPPRFLVKGGLYRLTRNPMYVGITAMLIGEAIFFKSYVLLVYAIIVLLGFHLRIIYYEEPTLRRLFGEAFESYCRRVPRWIPIRFSGAGKKR